MSVSVHKSRRGHAWRSLKVDVGHVHLLASVAADGGYRWAVSATLWWHYIGAQGDGHYVAVRRS
jgi:hypothetical protein